MTTVAVCRASWIQISFMLSEYAITVCMLSACYMVDFVCLHLCSLNLYLPKSCNVIGLLCNNKDAVYYYTTLLTAYIEGSFL